MSPRPNTKRTVLNLQSRNTVSEFVPHPPAPQCQHNAQYYEFSPTLDDER